MNVYFGGEVEGRKEGRLWISFSLLSGEVKAWMRRFAGEAHALSPLGCRPYMMCALWSRPSALSFGPAIHLSSCVYSPHGLGWVAQFMHVSF